VEGVCKSNIGEKLAKVWIGCWNKTKQIKKRAVLLLYRLANFADKKEKMFREILKKEGGKLCSFEMEFEDEFSDAFEFDQDLTIKGAIPLASLLRKKGNKE